MCTVMGSVLFVAGSLLFHPRLDSQVAYAGAVAAFIVGSALFTTAGAHALRVAWTLEAAPEAPTYERSALLGAGILGLAGGVFFLLGSLAFLPSWGAHGVCVGTGLFQAGNCAYLASSTWRLVEATKNASPCKRACASHGAYLFGAILFVCGCELLLRGHGTTASYAWTVGSCAFLLGSSLSHPKVPGLLFQ